MTNIHSALTGAELHVPGYQQSGDPGVVGAGKQWIDTTAGAGKWKLKVRNAADGAWETIYDPTAVAITGGSIDGTPVGATTRSTGRFTTVGIGGTPSASQQLLITQPSGTNVIARLTASGAGGAFLQLEAASTVNEISTNASGDWVVTSAGVAADVFKMVHAGAVTSTLVLGTGNVGIGGGTFGTSAASVLMLKNGTPPGSSPADSIQIYAQDVASSSEARVRDEAGNVATFSPHNPQMVDASGRPTDFVHKEHNVYTGNDIELDVYRAVEWVQQEAGETLIHVRALSPGQRENPYLRRLNNRRQQLRSKLHG